MKRINCIYILITTLLFVSRGVCALEPIVLDQDFAEYTLNDGDYEYYIDSSGDLSLEMMFAKKADKKFKETENILQVFLSTSKPLWVRFKVQNEVGVRKKWLIQAPLHIPGIKVYVPDGYGGWNKYQTGQRYDFNTREYNTRQIVFDLPSYPTNDPKVVYARVVPNGYKDFYLIISEQKIFSNYLVYGYYFIGVTYGIIFLMAFYNFIHFLLIREKVYIYYVMYTLCAALFISWKDGTGFQFFWSNVPEWNFFHYRVSLFLLIITLIIYARQFLSIKARFPKIDKLILLSIALCTIQFLVRLFNPDYFDPLPAIYFITIFFVFLVALYSLWKGYMPARYFIVGFSFMLIGLVIIKLRYLGILGWSWLTEYCMNYGVLIEIIGMSLAMGDRLKIIKEDRERAQKRIISQLEENEQLKDQVNRDLESKVKERTVELADKMQELNVTNEKLQYAVRELESMNVKLDLDNWKLKKNIKEETNLRISDKEVTYEKFLEIYPDQDACLRFIRNLKWPTPEAYICKKCDNDKYSDGKHRYSRKCSRCNYTETVTSGTLFHGVRFPLNMTFYITYMVTRNPKISMTLLSETLDLRKNTCWGFKKKVVARIKDYIKKNGGKPVKHWEDLIIEN